MTPIADEFADIAARLRELEKARGVDPDIKPACKRDPFCNGWIVTNLWPKQYSVCPSCQNPEGRAMP